MKLIYTLKRTIKQLKKTIFNYKFSYYFIKFTNQDLFELIKVDYENVFNIFTYELNVCNFIFNYLKNMNISCKQYEDLYCIVKLINNLEVINTNYIKDILKKVKGYKGRYNYINNYDEYNKLVKIKENIDAIIKKLNIN